MAGIATLTYHAWDLDTSTARRARDHDMFPIRDDNPTFRTPYTTYVIIALNVVVWALLQGFGAEPALSRSVCALGLIPFNLLDSNAAINVQGPAAAQVTQCLAVNSESWFTLITSMFMHGSWFHIIGNMWFLWIFGNNVEDTLGHLRFIFFYLATGVAGALVQVFTTADPTA